MGGPAAPSSAAARFAERVRFAGLARTEEERPAAPSAEPGLCRTNAGRSRDPRAAKRFVRGPSHRAPCSCAGHSEQSGRCRAARHSAAPDGRSRDAFGATRIALDGTPAGHRSLDHALGGRHVRTRSPGVAGAAVGSLGARGSAALRGGAGRRAAPPLRAGGRPFGLALRPLDLRAALGGARLGLPSPGVRAFGRGRLYRGPLGAIRGSSAVEARSRRGAIHAFGPPRLVLQRNAAAAIDDASAAPRSHLGDAGADEAAALRHDRPLAEGLHGGVGELSLPSQEGRQTLRVPRVRRPLDRPGRLAHVVAERFARVAAALREHDGTRGYGDIATEPVDDTRARYDVQTAAGSEVVHVGEVPAAHVHLARGETPVDRVHVVAAPAGVVRLRVIAAIVAAVVAGGAPAEVVRGVPPVDPCRRIDVARGPAPVVPADVEEPVAVVVGIPAPGIVRPPAQADGRVVPAAVGVGIPADGDVRAPHVARVRRVVVPVPVTVEGLDIGGVALADVLARGALRRVVGRLEAVGGPEVEAVPREAAAGDLRLLVALDQKIVAGAHRVGARARLDFDRPGANHDSRAAPDIGVDAHAGSAVGVDGRVDGVDAGNRPFIRPDDGKDHGTVGQVDRGHVALGALLLGEGNEPEAGGATDVEDVAVGERDFGAGRVVGLHLVAGRDRQVALGLDLAVRRGDDGDLTGRLPDIRIRASTVVGRRRPCGREGDQRSQKSEPFVIHRFLRLRMPRIASRVPPLRLAAVARMCFKSSTYGSGERGMAGHPVTRWRQLRHPGGQARPAPSGV